MVEVAVSDEYTSDFFFSFFEIFSVRQNIIHSRGVFVSKLESSVYDDNVVSDFYSSHIFTNLFHTTKRDDADAVADFW